MLRIHKLDAYHTNTQASYLCYGYTSKTLMLLKYGIKETGEISWPVDQITPESNARIAGICADHAVHRMRGNSEWEKPGQNSSPVARVTGVA